MGVISVITGSNLFWMGRYTERAFTTMKTLLSYYDEMLDADRNRYKDYLKSFGLFDTYGNMDHFLESFLFDPENPNSVRFSLDRAYDNGIVLRDEISTESLSFLQMAIDTLCGAKESCLSRRFSLLQLEDYIYAFWGCLDDRLYDSEEKNIVYCGKSTERLDLYFRLNYAKPEIEKEFHVLCARLREAPKNTPYRYNTQQLGSLVEIIGAEQEFDSLRMAAVRSLGRLFESETAKSFA